MDQGPASWVPRIQLCTLGYLESTVYPELKVTKIAIILGQVCSETLKLVISRESKTAVRNLPNTEIL